MSLERQLEQLTQRKKMDKCELCHNRMEYRGSGRYRCTFCGNETLDDFGKIKEYLEKNGPTPSGIIAQQTGVKRDRIEAYLKQGMIEIRDGGGYYLSCEKCGCRIRYGRFCPECVKGDIGNGLRTSYQDIGERPKQQDSEMGGRMHYLKRRK